jgi:hypothetical protein
VRNPDASRAARYEAPVGEEESTTSVGADQPGRPVKTPRIAILPTTSLGRWAVVLAAVFLPLVFAAGVVPRAAALGLACGVAGGVMGGVAIVRDRERAVSVLAALAPLVIAVGFVLAELMGG